MSVRRGCANILVALFAIAVALTIASAALEAITARTELAEHAPPGRLINIRPHRLHLDCQGEGKPIVILEAGRDRFGLDWWPVQRLLSANTTVCAYDRAGHGWSGRGPGERTPQRIADELHELLLRSGLEGPYVIAAMDAGAQYALWYAAAYPERIAGLVWVAPFIDAASPEAETRWERAARVQDASWTALSFASQLGLWPWVSDQVYADRLGAQDPLVIGAQSVLLRLPAHFTAAGREAAADEAYLDPAHNTLLPAPPQGVPRLVLVRVGSGGFVDSSIPTSAPVPADTQVGTMDIPGARWHAMQLALRTAFVGSDVIEIDTDSADIALEDPDAVAAAILGVARLAGETQGVPLLEGAESTP